METRLSGTGELTQCVKVLATKPGELNSVPSVSGKPIRERHVDAFKAQ